MKKSWIIGVDEVGRGPLAGPVAVGVVLVPADFLWTELPGVRDSKKLTEKKREEIFKSVRRLKAKCPEKLDYKVSMVSSKVIDQIGIVLAINLAMHRALKKIEQKPAEGSPPHACGGLPSAGLSECVVKLDGGLKAPSRYLHQETTVKGDQKEKIIGLASIMAKVTRDRYMTRLAARAAYQPYGFQKHKGYGTKAHRAAIVKYGLSDQHRHSFCTKFD